MKNFKVFEILIQLCKCRTPQRPENSSQSQNSNEGPILSSKFGKIGLLIFLMSLDVKLHKHLIGKGIETLVHNKKKI